MEYSSFLDNKRIISRTTGLDVDVSMLNAMLFDYQRDIVKWSLKKGKSAIFAGTGLGKTFMQSEWSKIIHRHKEGNVLILAPLAVSTQTVDEAKRLDIDIHLCRSQNDVRDGLNITNYEMLHKFDPKEFVGVVLDESSILKSFDGKMKTMIIDYFKHTPYKLACTATPAPNDYMELGNHAEFLGVMSRSEMLSMFFVHDGGDTSKWRIKGHAEDKFWEWVSSWAVLLRSPADLGYDDSKFILPPMHISEKVVKTNKKAIGKLFNFEARTLQERQTARRDSVAERVEECAKIVNSTKESVLVWCDLNIESEMLKKAIPDAVEVKGSDSAEHKEKAMMDFAKGKIRVLVSKPSICGFGLNFQICSNVCFVGLSDSFEQVFQAIRRCYRFGQKKEVNVYMIISDLEGAVARNINRKEEDFNKMAENMIKYTKHIVSSNIRSTIAEKTEYDPSKIIIIPKWLTEEKQS